MGQFGKLKGLMEEIERGLIEKGFQMERLKDPDGTDVLKIKKSPKKSMKRQTKGKIRKGK